MVRLRVRQGEKGENIWHLGVMRALGLWPRKGCRTQKSGFSGPCPGHLSGLMSSKVSAVKALCLDKSSLTAQLGDGRVTGRFLQPYLKLKGCP